MLARVDVRNAIESRRSSLKGSDTLATPEFVMRNLVREAQGAGPDTTSAARVSATKVLADILGLQNSQAAATEGFKTLLESLGRGIQAQKEAQNSPKQALQGPQSPYSTPEGSQTDSYKLLEASQDSTEQQSGGEQVPPTP